MKQNTKIILIIIMSIFLAVILTVQNTSKNNIQSDTIKRPNYKIENSFRTYVVFKR